MFDRSHEGGVQLYSNICQANYRTPFHPSSHSSLLDTIIISSQKCPWKKKKNIPTNRRLFGELNATLAVFQVSSVSWEWADSLLSSLSQSQVCRGRGGLLLGLVTCIWGISKCTSTPSGWHLGNPFLGQCALICKFHFLIKNQDGGEWRVMQWQADEHPDHYNHWEYHTSHIWFIGRGWKFGRR
jgi:hypothetical protein